RTPRSEWDERRARRPARCGAGLAREACAGSRAPRPLSRRARTRISRHHPGPLRRRALHVDRAAVHGSRSAAVRRLHADPAADAARGRRGSRMSDGRLLLAILAALPTLVIGASFLRGDVERLRRLAVAAAIAMLLAALVVAVTPALRAVSIRTAALTLAPGGEAIVRIDRLSAALLPFAAALWLLTVAVTPRASLDRGGLRRTALATLITLASFLTESPVVLLVLSVASVWTFLSALGDPAHQRQRRIVAAYLGLSTLLFGVGVALLIAPGVPNTPIETAGMWLIVIAALVRKGIVPFHAWVPEVFDHGRLRPAILFNAPQVGAYMTVVLIVPRASPEMLRTIALLALGTAVYGAALALVQRSARGACGYLFMSQSALVMAGLAFTSSSALAGGLLVWLSAGLAFAGLARSVLVLEARRGRLDLTKYH